MVRGTADYRRRLDSQVLGSEERRGAQPRGATRNMNAHRMSVREWVTNKREVRAQGYAPEDPNRPRQRAPSPIARADNDTVMRVKLPFINTSAPHRTAGERVSWLDRLNCPSTSRPRTHRRTSHCPLLGEQLLVPQEALQVIHLTHPCQR